MRKEETEMRKWFICGFLVLALSLLMSTAALAAEPEAKEGIKDVSMTYENVTANVNASNRDILDLSYNSADSNSEYVVFVTKDSSTPSESNLVYIDQKTGGKDFKIYPMSLVSGSDYYVWLSSNASNGIQEVTQVGTFGYYSTKPVYKLGDVTGEGDITVSDALYVLDMCVGTKPMADPQKSAAEVTGDGAVTVSDALYILDVCVGTKTLPS